MTRHRLGKQGALDGKRLSCRIAIQPRRGPNPRCFRGARSPGSKRSCSSCANLRKETDAGRLRRPLSSSPSSSRASNGAAPDSEDAAASTPPPSSQTLGAADRAAHAPGRPVRTVHGAGLLAPCLHCLPKLGRLFTHPSIARGPLRPFPTAGAPLGSLMCEGRLAGQVLSAPHTHTHARTRPTLAKNPGLGVLSWRCHGDCCCFLGPGIVCFREPWLFSFGRRARTRRVPTGGWVRAPGGRVRRFRMTPTRPAFSYCRPSRPSSTLCLFTGGG